MMTVEAKVYEFLKGKTAGHPVFASAGVFDNPFRDLDRRQTEGVWVGFAAGAIVPSPTGKMEIRDAALSIIVRAFIQDKDGTNRIPALEKAAEISEAIAQWFWDDSTMGDRCEFSQVLGFDNGGDVVDGADYAGCNLYVGVGQRDAANEQLLARARRTIGL